MSSQSLNQKTVGSDERLSRSSSEPVVKRKKLAEDKDSSETSVSSDDADDSLADFIDDGSEPEGDESEGDDDEGDDEF